MKSIDARGLSCPQPMLLAKEAIEAGDADKIEVTVDCEASIENISRLAVKKNWEASTADSGDVTVITLTKK